MTSLKFCANISWLFTELPELSERLRAAACAGFQAVEAAWLYGSDLRELQKVREETGLQVALINTPPGKSTQTCQGQVQLNLLTELYTAAKHTVMACKVAFPQYLPAMDCLLLLCLLHLYFHRRALRVELFTFSNEWKCVFQDPVFSVLTPDSNPKSFIITTWCEVQVWA